MCLRRISAVSYAALLWLTPPAFLGFARSQLSAINSAHAQAGRAYYRCNGQYVWIPDGTIAGQTGGYPYYGWYGYPYVPYRCVRLHHARYNYDGQPT
jgi:hypothetical protein